MSELHSYSLPCRMRPNQVLQVAQVVEQIPGMNISTSPIAGVESVPVIITVPPGTYMPVVFARILNALNTQVPSVMSATEGEVFAKSEEPKLASRPPEEHPFTLRRTSSRFRALLPHPLQDS